MNPPNTYSTSKSWHLNIYLNYSHRITLEIITFAFFRWTITQLARTSGYRYGVLGYPMASLLIRQLPLLNVTTGEAENSNNNIWIIKLPQYVQYDLITKFRPKIFAKESTETYLS